MYDYSKLKGRIVEICGTQGEFAKLIGLSEKTISSKLNGITPWKQSDITKAVTILHIDNEDIQAYFFSLKVQN